MFRVFFVTASIFAVGLAAPAGAAPAPIEIRTAASAPSFATASSPDYGYGRIAPQSFAAARAPVIDVSRTASARPAAADPAPARPPAPAPAARPDWLAIERVGPPYEVNGRWFAPSPEPGYEQQGRAALYPAHRRNGVMATGAPFDPRALSAAHPTLPIPSLVQVTNLAGGRDIIVRVTDRGPFGAGEIIALSDAAAEALGLSGGASANVHVRYLGPAPKPVRLTSATPGPRAAAASAAGHHVQVGVFAAEANARRVQSQLSALGPVSVEPLRQQDRDLFRVRLGPWRDAAQAEAARARAAGLGFTGARLVRG